MEETLEALPPKNELQDKKNYAINQSVEKSISANNSSADSTTIANEKQSRITSLVNFFNQLYGKIPVPHFAYLWTKQRGIFSFQINDATTRENIAKKAVQLSSIGVDVWHSVNPVCIEPADGKRGDETVVSYQTAIVVDIDIRSAAHKGDPSLLATDFYEAKSFLPFTPSLIIHSGYGLHAYYIFETPIAITDQNREELKRRNNLLLEIVRQKANGKKIDGVGDLPRILRTPSTFNYKLGVNNAPMCHIIEDSSLRFDPADLDQKLNALIIATPTTETQSKNSRKIDIDYFDDNPDLKEFRIQRMLDYISIVDGEYEKWLDVGFALFNEGMECSVWEQWSRTQPEFKEGECERKWNGFHHDPNGISIASLYHWATEGGYVETDVRNEFLQFHPELAAKKKNPVSSIDSLKAELRSVKKAHADFDAEKNAAIEHLKNVETFDSDSVFADEIVTAAAFAKIFDKKTFSDFKGEITLFNRKTKEKKASVSEWSAVVRDKAAEINSRQNDLLTRHNEIQAQIRSLSFVATNDDLQNFSIPVGYSVSDNGIEKVAGESMITVCRTPVIIKAKTFSVDEKIFKLTLAYMNQSGKLKALPPTEAAIVFNRNKLVDLANNDLDAFNAENENNFPLTYTVPRCGWYHFNGTDFFIDPRKQCSIIDDDKNIKVVVDSLSLFANSLRQKGNLDAWKKIYQLAKKSPVARIMVAASIAPILLKILGERNFLLYICAPTRAGKTTALYLAASAVGDEKMIRSFDATKNGLAGAAADVNDFAFLVFMLSPMA